MAKEFKLTRERLKELEEELNYLKTTREKEVAEQIKEAGAQISPILYSAPSATFPRTVNMMKRKMSRPSCMAASQRSRTSCPMLS